MNAQPAICPICGELLIVWTAPGTGTLIVPAHPDRVMPVGECAASARLIRDGRILQD